MAAGNFGTAAGATVTAAGAVRATTGTAGISAVAAGATAGAVWAAARQVLFRHCYIFPEVGTQIFLVSLQISSPQIHGLTLQYQILKFLRCATPLIANLLIFND
jgi:hypothetical protein